MLSCLHPISLFTRTDSEATTLYHSFYLIEYLRDDEDVKVIQRYPQDKPQIDTIESGLKLFIVQRLSTFHGIETTGKFVVTSSDSSRYYAFFRSYNDKVFVAVSSLPNMSLSRTIFDLLIYEEHDCIPLILLSLCELPILPTVGLQYDLVFTKGIASLKFSLAEQVEDVDIDFIVLNVMTPLMLVKAWESIILERKVLVVSSSDACTIACCEYLRRMVLPLTIVNTYVPLLPLQLIDAVDAPFPYLLGANIKLLKENILDLSDTVVIDLDTRKVIPAVNKNASADTFASIQIMSKLVQEVHDIMIMPIGEWFDRFSNDSIPNICSEDSYTLRSAKLLQIFKRTNLELISARSCSVKAFWRRPTEPLFLHHSDEKSHNNMINNSPWRETIYGSPVSRRSNSILSMGGFNYQDGICSGFMQLYKELQDENEQISNFLQCWVELDQYLMSVYQYADDLPILSVLVKDIQTVSPVAVEPEGHVFELVIKDSMSYRFTVTDPESRQKWISTIDRRKMMDFSKYNDDGDYKLPDRDVSTRRNADNSSQIAVQHIQSVINGVTQSNTTNGNATNNLLTPGRRASLNANEISLIENNISNNMAMRRIWTGYEMKQVNIDTYIDSNDSDSNQITGITTTLGFPQICPEENTDVLSWIAKEDSFFRLNFSRTQMMTSLHSQLECVEYQEIFKKLNIRMEKLLSCSYILDEHLNIKYIPSTTTSTDANTIKLTSQHNITIRRASTTSALVEDPPKQQLKYRFASFFNKKIDSEEENQKLAKLELQREKELELKLELELEQQRKSIVLGKIYTLTASYRRTQPELIDMTVQTRQTALQGLVYDHIYNVYLQKKHIRSKYAVISFPIVELLKSISIPELGCVTDHTTTVISSDNIQESFEKNLSIHNNKPDISISKNISISMDSSGRNDNSKLITDPSEKWINHIWLGMSGKSFEQYTLEQPVLNQIQRDVEPSIQTSITSNNSITNNTTANNNNNNTSVHPMYNSSLVYDDETMSESDIIVDMEPEEVDKPSIFKHSAAELLQEFLLFTDQRNKNEEIQRKLIKEMILNYFQKEHQSNIDDKEYEHYALVRQILLGCMYQALGHIKEAILCYANGGLLVDQRRIMTCLVLQFIKQKNEYDCNDQLIIPTSSIHQNDINDNNITNPLKITTIEDDNNNKYFANQFIDWCSSISPLLGKFAYRLMLELVYTNLLLDLDRNNTSAEEIANMNTGLELGSFRTFSGSHRNAGAANRKATRTKAELNGTILNTDFVYIANTEIKCEYLNNSVICTAIKVDRSPGELSVLLLTELTEIMKTYCKSPVGIKNSSRSIHGYSKLKITPQTMEDLTSSSAYKAFEQHCCILQKIELTGMHIDERVQFFINIYNTITVHAIMIRGSPGTSMLERSSFMRSSKYNIGGNLFSLFEIEHGILRHSSTKAMIFGPLTISVNFADKDPKKKLVLEQKRPNISFCLFTAMVSSPTLIVLKDSTTVNEDMNHHARRFLLETVKLDSNHRSVCLPGLIRIYWADFGGSRMRVLKQIGSISGPDMTQNLKPYLSPTEGLKAKVEFSKLDWSPILSIGD